MYIRRTRSPVQNLISTINYWFREYNKIKEINIETQTEYHNITDSIEVVYNTSYIILNY